jgi:hypothetical protein
MNMTAALQPGPHRVSHLAEVPNRGGYRVQSKMSVLLGRTAFWSFYPWLYLNRF